MTQEFNYGELASDVIDAFDEDDTVDYHEGREVYGDFKSSLEYESITDFDTAYTLFMELFGWLV